MGVAILSASPPTGVGGPRVALVGTLDTKAEEYAYVRERLAAAGVGSVLIDAGVLGTVTVDHDVTRDQVATAAGTTVAALADGGDRSQAMVSMGRGAAQLVTELVETAQVAGVMMLGGSNAAFVMSQVAGALPFGVPKLLVSTIAAGDTRPYVGTSDLMLMYPVVDIAGLNSISRPVLARAADALAGMVHGAPVDPGPEHQAVVGCSMFGVTTPCVMAVHDAMVAEGDEVHVFHASGTGGRSLEAMIRAGAFQAIADVTTTELVDELVGGVCSAGPDRLTAAAGCGVPQVVSVGALDMVNFGAAATVPERFADRRLHAHNPAVTLMRTTPAENEAVGRDLAVKLNRSTAFVEVHVPARGFSQISVAGGVFHDPVADDALISTLRAELAPHVGLVVHDLAVNDYGFAREIVLALHRALISPKGLS